MQADSSAVLPSRTSFWTGENGLWLPPQWSTTAHEIDGIFNFILITGTVLTLLVSAAILYFVWRYRRRSHADRPVDVHESKALEMIWIVVPTLLVLVVFFWGFRAYVGTAIPPDNAVTVHVTAKKWAWAFEYRHPDGRPIAQGFGEIVVPVGQPVRLQMISQDVLHSFYVPEFRIKHDVLPNRQTFVWFEAPREGVYQVVCTEYCGTAHSNMGAKIRVVSVPAFNAYLRNGFLPGEQPPAMSPADLGETLYTGRNCNTCHSIDGSAGVGPTWQGLWGAARPGSDAGEVNDAYIAQSIVAPQAYLAPGFAGGMPSYEGQLDETQQAAIAAYIRSINGAATAADTTLATADTTALGGGAAATP